jgi:hypothetical protein
VPDVRPVIGAMSGKSTMKNFQSMLAGAKRAERTVEVCLRGDLAARHQELERQLELAQKKPDTGKEGNGVGALIEEIEAVETEMREHSYTFRFQALPRFEFRALMKSHPPREDTEAGGLIREDAALGVNQETFFPAIIRAAVYDPELDDAEWGDLLDDKLTDYQYQELAWAAWNLNNSEVSVPFSRAVSLARRATADE